MNTYFLSLLQPEKERKKNVTNKHYVSIDDDFAFYSQHQWNNYLKTKFPFLQPGDLINFKSEDRNWHKYSETWDGNQVKESHSFLQGQNFHPYFFDYDKGNNYAVNLLSPQIRDRILGSHFKSKRDRLIVNHFKLGKVKYQLVFQIPLSFRIDPLSYLKIIKQELEDYFEFQTPNVDQPFDYLTKYKKRLFF
jgi:hypothetical protein